MVPCQGDVIVAVIGSIQLGRGLFLFPARIASKIEELIKQNLPKQGQEIGPLEVRPGLEVITQGYRGMQIVWIIDRRRKSSEASIDEILTPSLLDSFYNLRTKIILCFGIPASGEETRALKQSSAPALFRKRYL